MKELRFRPSRAFSDFKATLDGFTANPSDTSKTRNLRILAVIVCKELQGATISLVERECRGFWASIVTAHACAARLLAANVTAAESLEPFKATSLLQWSALTSFAKRRDPALPTLALAILRGDALNVYAQILASVRSAIAAEMPVAASSGTGGQNEEAGGSSSRRHSSSNRSNSSRGKQPSSAEELSSVEAQPADMHQLLSAGGIACEAALALMGVLSADGPEGPMHNELLEALARSGVVEHAAATVMWVETEGLVGAAGRGAAAAEEEEDGEEGGEEGGAPVMLLLHVQLNRILGLHSWPQAQPAQPPQPPPGSRGSAFATSATTAAAPAAQPATAAAATAAAAAATATAGPAAAGPATAAPAAAASQDDGAARRQHLLRRIVSGPAVQWLALSALQIRLEQVKEQEEEKEEEEEDAPSEGEGLEAEAQNRRAQGGGRGQAAECGDGGCGSAAITGVGSLVAESSKGDAEAFGHMFMAIELAAHVFAFCPPSDSDLLTRAAAATAAARLHSRRREALATVAQPQPPPQLQPQLQQQLQPQLQPQLPQQLQPQPQPSQQQAAQAADARFFRMLLFMLYSAETAGAQAAVRLIAEDLAAAWRRLWVGLRLLLRVWGRLELQQPAHAAARLGELWVVVAAPLCAPAAAATTAFHSKHALLAIDGLPGVLASPLAPAAPAQLVPAHAPQPVAVAVAAAATAADDQAAGQSGSVAEPAAAEAGSGGSSDVLSTSGGGCSYSLRCALDAGLLPALEQLLRQAMAGLTAALAATVAGSDAGRDAERRLRDASAAILVFDTLLCQSGVWPAVLAHAAVEDVVPLVATLARAAAVAVEAAAAAEVVGATAAATPVSQFLAGRLCLSLTAMLEQQQAVMAEVGRQAADCGAAAAAGVAAAPAAPAAPAVPDQAFNRAVSTWLCCNSPIVDTDGNMRARTRAPAVWRPAGFSASEAAATEAAAAEEAAAEEAAAEEAAAPTAAEAAAGAVAVQAQSLQSPPRPQLLADWAALQWLPVLMSAGAVKLAAAELAREGNPAPMHAAVCEPLLGSRLSRSLARVCRHFVTAVWYHSRSPHTEQQRGRAPPGEGQQLQEVTESDVAAFLLSQAEQMAWSWKVLVGGKASRMNLGDGLQRACCHFHMAQAALTRARTQRTAGTAAARAAGDCGADATDANTGGAGVAGTGAGTGAGADVRGGSQARPSGGRGGGGKRCGEVEALGGVDAGHLALETAAEVMDLAELATVDAWFEAEAMMIRRTGDAGAHAVDGAYAFLEPFSAKEKGARLVRSLQRYGLRRRPRLEAFLLMLSGQEQQQQPPAAAAAAAATGAAPTASGPAARGTKAQQRRGGGQSQAVAAAAKRAERQAAAVAVLDELAERHGLAGPSMDLRSAAMQLFVLDPASLGQRLLLKDCDKLLSSETALAMWMVLRTAAPSLLSSQALCGNPACRSLDGPSALLPPGAGKVCARCKAVRYCCGACQLEHWRQRGGHEEAGGLMRKSLETLRTAVAQVTAAQGVVAAGEAAA